MESTSKKIGRKVSANQKEMLVSFLGENLELARGQFEGLDGNRQSKEKWNEVADILNAAGGALKDGEKWKKTWTDLRLYVKNRAAEIKVRVNGLGRQKKLTELEERIINIMSWNSIVGDTNAAPKVGLPINLSRLDPSTSSQIIRENLVEIMIEETLKEETVTMPFNAIVETRSHDVPTSSLTNINATLECPHDVRNNNILQTAAAALQATVRRRKRSLEEIMEDFLEERLVEEERKRNLLLERQIEVEKGKVAAINNLTNEIRNNKNLSLVE